MKAVDGVTFSLEKGKTLGIVGESGCGKSTLGKAIIRLHEPTSGDVKFKGSDFLAHKGEQLRDARRNIQMIFQDPFASLDPRKTIAQIIGEPLKIHKIGNDEEKRAKIIELIKKVGLKPIHLDRYPHEFSGGQRQRISIARCLALQPELIIADEPVSALDVSVQAQVINLMRKLQKEFDLTYIFISHDLSVVEYFCDEVAVMYLGKVVEKAPTKELFSNPQHPYTKALLASIPKVGQGKVRKRKILTGDVPSPLNPPSGCTFHPRCESSTEECKVRIPEFVQLSKTHKASCHLINEEKNQ